MLEKLEGGLRFDGSDVLLPYLYDQTATLGDYARAKTLSAVVEPRSLFDDATHAYDDLTGRAKGTNVALAGLYAEPSELAFGSGQRATYVSIMRVGGSMDDELPVKRVDVAGHPDKLFGKLRSLVEGGYTVAFSAPNFRARQDMKLALVDNGIPIQETLDVLEGAEDPARDVEGGPEASLDDKAFAKRRLRRGGGQPGGRGHTAGHGHPQGEAGAGVAGRHAGRARCLPHASGAWTSPRSRFPTSRATTWCMRRTAWPTSRSSCGATWTARRATTCCLNTRKATSCTCPWSSWTA